MFIINICLFNLESVLNGKLKNPYSFCGVIDHILKDTVEVVLAVSVFQLVAHFLPHFACVIFHCVH